MSHEHKCDKCKGEGRVIRFADDIKGKKVVSAIENCKQCGGSGVCGVCGGSGAVYGHAHNVIDGRSMVVVEASCPGRRKSR